MAKIDLKRLRYVVEVARAGAITTAAETLNITQPALTRSIAEVESALGAKLFKRHARGMQLTESGRRFVERARQILGDFDDLVTDTQQPKPLFGRVRVGVAPGGFLPFVTETIVELAEANPDVAVEVTTGSAQALGPRAIQGDIDVIVGVSSDLRRWREFKTVTLRPLYFGCMFRKDHPLAQLPAPQESDILAYPVIFPATVEPIYSDLAQRYAANGLPPIQPRYMTDDVGLIMRLVDTTNAFFPLSHWSPTFSGFHDRYLLFEGIVQMPTYHLSVAYSASRLLPAATELFVQTLLNREGSARNSSITD